MSIRSRVVYYIYGCMVLVSISLCARLDSIKGTYTILSDRSKDLSLIYGALAYESGYLKHLYDYGALVRRDSSEKVPAIVRLVEIFFHRVRGGEPQQHVRAGDFVLTNVLSRLDDTGKKAILEGIAWTLAKAIQFRTYLESLGDAEYNKKALLNKLNQTIKGVATRFNNMPQDMGNLARLASQQPVAQSDLRSVVQDSPDLLAGIDAACLKLFKVLWNAYQEESVQNPIFPPGSANTVILGIVYAIAGGNKQLIRDFYKKLNEIMVNVGIGTIFSVTYSDLDWESWVQDKFSSAGAKTPLEDVLKLDLKTTDILRGNFEQIVYVALLPDLYPPQVSYGMALYQWGDPGQAVRFADCMETTLRNLVNFILYNPETMKFNVADVFPNATRECKMFYERYASVTSIHSDDARNAWAQVVSNIPGARYAKNTQGSIGYELEPSISNLIIVLNHVLGLDLFAEEQGSSSDEKLKNALTRINKDFIKTYLPRLCQVLQINFNGFSGYRAITLDDVDSMDGTMNQITTRLSLRNNIDVEIATSYGHGEFAFSVGSDQGAQQQRSIVPWLNDSLTVLVLSDVGRRLSPEELSLLHLMLYKRPDMASTYLARLQSNGSELNGIFYLPLKNSDFVFRLISVILDAGLRKYLPSQGYELRLRDERSWCLLRLLFNLCRDIPDEDRRLEALLGIHAIFLLNNSADSVSTSRSQSKEVVQWYESATELVLKAMQDLVARAEVTREEDDTLHGLLSRMLNLLFASGRGYKELLNLIDQMLGRSIVESARLLLLLFSDDGTLSLLNPEARRSLYQIALRVAQAAASHEVDLSLSLKILDMLASKNFTDDEEDIYRQVESESLYMVDRAMMYGEGTTFVTGLSAKESVFDALNLLATLVNKGKGYEHALKAAQYAVESVLRQYDGNVETPFFDMQILAKALNLFRTLVAHGQGYQEAENAIDKVADKCQIIVDYDNAIELARELVIKQRGYDAAIKLAQNATGVVLIRMERSLSQARVVWAKPLGSALSLFRTLVAHGQGYQEAEKVIDKVAYDFSLNTDAIELARELVIKQRGYDAAIKLAQGAMNVIQRLDYIDPQTQTLQSDVWRMFHGDNICSPKTLLSLFLELFEKGQGYDAAMGMVRDFFVFVSRWQSRVIQVSDDEDGLRDPILLVMQIILALQQKGVLDEETQRQVMQTVKDGWIGKALLNLKVQPDQPQQTE